MKSMCSLLLCCCKRSTFVWAGLSDSLNGDIEWHFHESITVISTFMPLSPDIVSEGIMFSGCLSAAFVCLFVCLFVHRDRSCYHGVSRMA